MAAVEWVIFRIRDDAPRPLRYGEYWDGWRDAVEELGRVTADNVRGATRQAIDQFPGVSLFCQSVASVESSDGYRTTGSRGDEVR